VNTRSTITSAVALAASAIALAAPNAGAHPGLAPIGLPVMTYATGEATQTDLHVRMLDGRAQHTITALLCLTPRAATEGVRARPTLRLVKCGHLKPRSTSRGAHH
jgi:hypothetical protein